MNLSVLKKISSLQATIESLNQSIIYICNDEKYKELLNQKKGRISKPQKNFLYVPQKPDIPSDDVFKKAKIPEDQVNKMIPFKLCEYKSYLGNFFKDVGVAFKENAEESKGHAVFVFICFLPFYFFLFMFNVLREAITFLFRFPIGVSKSKKVIDEQRKELLEEIRTSKKKVEVYNKEVKFYEESLSKYQEDSRRNDKEYNERCKKVEEENEKIIKHNNLIDEKINEYIKSYETETNKKIIELEKERDALLESERISKKYLSAINEIIDIIEDYRADSIKEAIEVYLNDKHKNKMLLNQEMALETQRQYEEEKRELEERQRYYDKLEREEKERQQKEDAQRQCVTCLHYGKCRSSNLLTGVCPRYVDYKLYNY